MMQLTRIGHLLLSILFLLSVSRVTAQNTLSLAQQKEEFAIFRGGLQEGHGGLHLFISKEAFDKSCDSVAQTFQAHATVESFYLKLRYLIALLRHGHTRINLPYPNGTNFRMAVLQKSRMYLPLRIAIYNKRMYVHSDCSDEQVLKRGTELLQINGVPVQQLMDTMLHYVFADGRNKTFKYFFLDNYYYFHFLYQLLYPDVTAFTIRTADGSKPVRIKAKSPEAVAQTYLEQNKQSPSHFEDPLDYQPAIAPNTAYLKVGSFYKGFIENFGKQFEPFIDSAFTDMHKRSTANLIIDVRDNEGGGDHYNSFLFSYISARPFTAGGFERVPGKTFPFIKYAVNLSDDVRAYTQDPAPFLRDDTSLWLKDEFADKKFFQPAKALFRGRIYVLTNGGTFSAGNSFVSDLYNYRRTVNQPIIFVGAENGGDIYSNVGCAGTGYTIQLPHSAITVDMPFLCAGELNKTYPKKTLPDIEIHPTGQDLVRGSDRVLQYVLQQIREVKAAGSVRPQTATMRKKGR